MPLWCGVVDELARECASGGYDGVFASARRVWFGLLDLLEHYEGRQRALLDPQRFAAYQMTEDSAMSASESDDELMSSLTSDLGMLNVSEDRTSRSGLASEYANFWLHLALPHGDVETRDLYKHIEQSLLEPQRMKQLLVWCGTRSMLPKQHGGLKDASEGLAVDSGKLPFGMIKKSR